MRLKHAIVAAAFGVGALLTAPAYAAPITDIYDPSSDVYFGEGGAACTGANPDHGTTSDTATVGTCQTLTYTHTIAPEFSGPPQVLLDAMLTLYFHDDETGIPEYFSVNWNGDTLSGSAGPVLITTGSGVQSNFGYDVKLAIAENGTIEVTLTRDFSQNQNSDFYFEKSIVTANYSDGRDLVVTPEPASMMLLGTGLAGVAARLRRRKQQA